VLGAYASLPYSERLVHALLIGAVAKSLPRTLYRVISRRPTRPGDDLQHAMREFARSAGQQGLSGHG
jgi:hypothetical protein